MRRIFCQNSGKKMGYSGADVARFLAINTFAVNRLAASEELPETEKYLSNVLEPLYPLRPLGFRLMNFKMDLYLIFLFAGAGVERARMEDFDGPAVRPQSF